MKLKLLRSHTAQVMSVENWRVNFAETRKKNLETGRLKPIIAEVPL